MAECPSMRIATKPPTEGLPLRSSLGELALLFLRLGATAFGGPAAHIALMEDEVVRRRRYLSREEFLDLLGATNLIPGPNSTEMAIHIGHRRGGWPGLFVAGACFILPAALIVWALAWAYVHYGRLPAVEGVLYGIKPVVIAVVVQALVALGRTALRSRTLVAAGLLAAAFTVLRRERAVRPLRDGRGGGAGPSLRTQGPQPGWRASRPWRPACPRRPRRRRPPPPSPSPSSSRLSSWSS